MALPCRQDSVSFTVSSAGSPQPGPLPLLSTLSLCCTLEQLPNVLPHSAEHVLIPVLLLPLSLPSPLCLPKSLLLHDSAQ